MNTSKTELNFEPYVMALTEQVEQYLSGLDELLNIPHLENT